MPIGLHLRRSSSAGLLGGPQPIAHPAHRVPTDLLHLQQRAGNKAVSAALGRLAVQRQPDPKAKPAGATGDVTFVIRKDKDKYIKDVEDYIKTTLSGSFVEVDNLEDICRHVAGLQRNGTKLRSVRIVSHGQTDIGGVGMTPAGEKTWRFVSPAEVDKFAKSPDCQALKTAMAPGGSVEFWGCNLGSVPGAGEAWARLFNAPVRSSFGEMKIGVFDYPGLTSSKDVPKDKKAQARFRATLVGWYKTLSTTGEVPVLAAEDAQFEYMKKLFDSSGGKIRSRVVTRKSDNAVFRPGDAKEDEMWHTADP
jgi:hypothetical protein